jgi:peptidoglycan/xylan/chitin deacetylase (PgdA/CDA1 family)
VTRVPVLLYHSISDRPPPFIAGFAVTPADFECHLDLAAERGCTPLTVSAFADVLRGRAPLPRRALVMTFDDGVADFCAAALPALQARAVAATLYVPTGLLPGSPQRVHLASVGEALLDWSQLAEIDAAGVELGAHSHTHPHLDTLRTAAARDEIRRSKALLEDELGHEVRTFAYPNGYSSTRVRRLVAEAGFGSACAVKNAFSSPADDPLAIARLMLTSATTVDDVRAWLDGTGAPDAPRRDAPATRAWRAYRRGRALVRRRPGSDLA